MGRKAFGPKKKQACDLHNWSGCKKPKKSGEKAPPSHETGTLFHKRRVI